MKAGCVAVLMLPGGRYEEEGRRFGPGAVVDLHPAMAAILVSRGTAQLLDYERLDPELREQFERTLLIVDPERRQLLEGSQ